jgi:ubiquinone/menaquinone biosynthesis C-methylase UbiE
MNFPSPVDLARLMEKAGLEKVAKYSLTLGITHLHLGEKPGVPQP